MLVGARVLVRVLHQVSRGPRPSVVQVSVVQVSRGPGACEEKILLQGRVQKIKSPAAKRAGVMLAISTDAHSTQGLDLMRCGVIQARRAGLEAKDVANTRTLTGFRRLLAKK